MVRTRHELKETSKTVRARDFTRYRSSRPIPSSSQLSRKAPAPGSADTAERVGDETLVDASGDALLCGDLLQAINGALVDVLLNWLPCLHLEAPTDGVEGIADGQRRQ